MGERVLEIRELKNCEIDDIYENLVGEYNRSSLFY